MRARWFRANPPLPLPSRRGGKWRNAIFLFLLLSMLAPAPAYAHTRSQSQSSWAVDGDAVDVRVEAEAIDATRLYALGGDATMATMFADEVAGAFDVSAGGQACAPAGPARQSNGGAGRVVAAMRFDCPTGALTQGPIEIESRLFLRVAPSHLHFIALRNAQGHSAEAVLTESNPRAVLVLEAAPAQESFWTALGRFFPVGAVHVWSGADHIAFMLALLLLVGRRLRAAVFAATGFTLGHTATLGFAATGVLSPDREAIEALIGFTIAFVALEIGDQSQARMRAWSLPAAALLAVAGAASLWRLSPMSPLVWFGLTAFVLAYPRGFPRDAAWLAAIFGLIHGCGFAAALSELDLPQPRLLASLIGFNLGVEAAQVVVIGVALVLGAAVPHAPAALRANAAAIAGATLFALGCYWFVGRLAG